MEILKLLFVLVTFLVTFGIFLFAGKQIAFVQKKENKIDLNEGIYLIAVLISMSIILRKVTEIIINAYERLKLIEVKEFYGNFLITSASTIFIGLLFFIFCVYFSKLFIKIIGDEISEDKSSIIYYLLLSGLLISFTLSFIEIVDSILQFLLPSLGINGYF